MDQTPKTKPQPGFLFDRYDRIALILCLLIFSGWFILLSFKYNFFGYYDWDLAFYAQAMHSLIHGTTYTSIMGMNFLCNHAEYITFALIPIFKLFPHPLTLIFLKILSTVAAGFILYLIGKNLLTPFMGILMMLLYFIYPANLFALLYEFHFESLGIGLLMLMFYFYKERKYRPFLLCMFLAALVKENITLVVAAFGIYAFFATKERKWQWGGVPFVCGIFIFCLTMLILTPAFRRGISDVPNQYIGHYQHVGGLLVEPVRMIHFFLSPLNTGYLRELLGPVIYLALIGPDILFIVAPIFLQHLLSHSPQTHTIGYHYSATLAPFIFLATIYALHRLKQILKPLSVWLLLVMLTTASVLNVLNYKRALADRLSWIVDPMDPVRARMIQEVPTDEGVIATLSFLASLSQRSDVYAYLNIVRNIDGLRWLPFTLPEKVTYALLDLEDSWTIDETFVDPQTVFPRIQKFFSEHDWRVLDATENIVLLQKKGSGPKLLERFAPAALNDTAQGNTPVIRIDEKFRLLHFEMGQATLFPQASNTLPMTFWWQADEDITDNYKLVITVKGEAGTIGDRLKRIGYSIYPTMTWKAADTLKENYWMRLPQLPPGQYSLYLTFINATRQEICPIQISNQPGEGLPPNQVKVGEIAIQ